MGISSLQQSSLCHLFKRALAQFLAHDMLTHAKAVTYQVLFSFFPFIIFFIALLGFFDLSNLFDLLRRQSEVFFLIETAPQLNSVLDQMQERRHGILSFGFAFSIWASSSAMRSMMKALNVVYGVKEGRPGWKRYTLSAITTLAIGIMLAMAVTLLLIRPVAMQTLVQQFGVKPLFATMWTWWLRWPAFVLLLTITVTVVYWTAPNIRQRFCHVMPGAFLAVFAWLAASLTFDLYVRNVAGYDHLYGSIGTAVVLLLYFFISSIIFLFGAEVNAAVAHYALWEKRKR